MRKLLLAILLSIAVIIPATPASAHYDDYHLATCQPPGASLWYMWPSAYGGTRVVYFRAYYGYINVELEFLNYYAQTGYECGWLGPVTTSAWIQQVCEFGYCGTGMIQAFTRGQVVKHFAGPAAGWVAAYSY